MKQNFIAALLAGASAIHVAPAHAQQSQGGSQEAAPADAGAPANVSDIVVTGSRIKRDGYDAPTPVTVATPEELVKSTPTNLPDALNKLPQFQNSSSPSRSTHNFANSASNGNILNLRGVGGNRTLILFDGLRVPPTTYRGEVDTNVIPNMLVERVDVVTAGASAAYGSDAVAGVVNFVLNRRFSGLSATLQAGVYQRGDNDNYRLGIAGGTDVFGGKGHVLLSAEYFSSGGMLRSQRESGRQNYVFAGRTPGAGAPGSAANPLVIYSNSRQTVMAEGGVVITGPFAGQRFLPDGTLTPFNPGTPTGTPAFSVGGDGFTIPANTTAVAPLETTQLFGRFDYEFSENLNAYVQGTFTRSDLTYLALANALAPPAPATIFSGNAFLQPSVQSLLTANNTPSFDISEYFGEAGGPNPTKERTDFYMATVGFEGRFGGSWSWNAAYTHGRSEHHVDQHHLLNFQKAYAALDAVRDPATGNIVCRPTLDPDPVVRQRFAGCVPFNPMGFRAYSAAALNYITGTSSYDAAITQDSITASVQGDIIDLPAGPVSVAFGGEWRRQKLKLDSNADPALLDTPAERNEYFRGLRGVSPAALFYFVTNVGTANGSVKVKEGFAEIGVPVLKDTPFFQSLELNGAGRITDYSTSGTVKTWKLGATWKPVNDLLLRVTKSRDIRAPSLFDLFAGDQFGIGTLVDPVSGETNTVTQITGGNPNLKPEKADTFTFGGVVTPRFLPGFSMSVDYFKLKIDGAIGTLSIGQAIQNCLASGGTAPECALVMRPSPKAFPTGARIAPSNIAFLKTSGIDFDATYRTELGNGNLNLRLYASYLDSYKTQQSATAPVLEFAGRGSSANQPIGRPKWRGTFNVNYNIGGLGLFVSEQYIGKLKLGSQEPNQIFADPKVKPVWYTDATISYRLPSLGGTTELFLTVNNLFDKDPPLIPGTLPGLNLPTIISLYDTVGRAFTFGARAKF